MEKTAQKRVHTTAFHLYKGSKTCAQSYSDRKQVSVEEGVIRKLEGNGYVHCLDWGDGCTDVKIHKSSFTF